MLFLVLQNVQQQRGSIFNHVALHQSVDDGVDVDQRTSWILDEHSGEAGSVGWIAIKNRGEEGDPVRGVVFLLNERNQLV